MKKLVLFPLVVLMLCTLLIGCKAKAPNESLIADNLRNEGVLRLGQQEFWVDNITISLQRSEGRHNYANCILTLCNDICTTEVQCCITHTYHDSVGWILTNIETLSDYTIVPITGVLESEITKLPHEICKRLYLNEETCIFNIINNEFDLASGVHSITFLCQNNEPLCTLESHITVIYSFNSEYGLWSIEKVTTPEWKYTWNLENLNSQYRVDSVYDNHELYVEFTSISSDNITLSYESLNTLSNDWVFGTVTLDLRQEIGYKDNHYYVLPRSLVGIPLIYIDEFHVQNGTAMFGSINEDVSLLFAPDGVYFYDGVSSEYIKGRVIE